VVPYGCVFGREAGWEVIWIGVWRGFGDGQMGERCGGGDRQVGGAGGRWLVG
jgi:hypothetical protein